MKEAKKKRDRKAKFEALEISDVEHSIDKSYGVEVVPTECWIIHFYDKYGNHRFQEVDKNLN